MGRPTGIVAASKVTVLLCWCLIELIVPSFSCGMNNKSYPNLACAGQGAGSHSAAVVCIAQHAGQHNHRSALKLLC